jgi:hypothetical protein
LTAVARFWWTSLRDFHRDVLSADHARLAAMCDWAGERELDADRPGIGRNPKARRMYRQMREVAEEESRRRHPQQD